MSDQDIALSMESFLDAGIRIGVEQAVKLRTLIENQLRAQLKGDHYDYFRTTLKGWPITTISAADCCASPKNGKAASKKANGGWSLCWKMQMKTNHPGCNYWCSWETRAGCKEKARRNG